MKLIISSILLISSISLFGITVPNDAQSVSGLVSSVGGTYLVESGNTASFSTTNAIIYVENGATISISSVGGTVYLETGANLTNNSSVNTQVLRNQTFSQPQSGVATLRPGENVDTWVYFSVWPWVYIEGGGWHFLDPSEQGLWAFPASGGDIILLEK